MKMLHESRRNGIAPIVVILTLIAVALIAPGTAAAFKLSFHTVSLHVRRRDGITPVIGTVVIIAVTLIAAVAVTGFSFGLFSSFTSSPEVTAIGSSVSASGLTGGAGTSLTATCATASSVSYVQLTNTGTASITVNGGTMIFGGSTVPISTASCGTGQVPLIAGGTIYVQLSAPTKLKPTATAGEQYLVSLVLANGVTIPVSGTFLA